jgi:hypothetical protein
MTLNLCALPLGTRLKTRDGRSARLLATDLQGEQQVVAAVMTDGGYEAPMMFYANGIFAFDSRVESPQDIVSVEKPKIKCMAWLVPDRGCIGGYRLIGAVSLSPDEEWPASAQPIELEA